MEAGWLRPVVGSQYPLDQAAQAHHDIIESPGAAGKIVLTMWGRGASEIQKYLFIYKKEDE